MVSLWAPTTPSGSRASSRYHEDAYEKEYECEDNSFGYMNDFEKDNFSFQSSQAMMNNSGILPPGVLYSQKIPPSFSGQGSWFAYEDTVREWADITTISADKQGVTLRSALVGQAAIYKELLDRTQLLQITGVEYFLSVLRTKFIKGASNIFLGRLIAFMRLHRGKTEMNAWMAKYQIHHQRLTNSWMDLLGEPLTSDQPEFKRITAALVADGMITCDISGSLTPEQISEINRQVNDIYRANHKFRFPLNDNLMTLLFIVASDLTEMQRQALTTQLTIRNVSIDQYTWENVSTIIHEVICQQQTSIEDPSLRKRQDFRGPRTFFVEDYGECEGHSGYWVEDAEDGTEGFLDEYEDELWIWDEDYCTWAVRSFKGRTMKRGKGRKKGKGKGKGKGRKGKYRFRSNSYNPGKGRPFGYTTGGTPNTGDDWYNPDLLQNSEEWNTGHADALKGKGKGKGKGKDKGKGKGKAKGKYHKGGKPEGTADTLKIVWLDEQEHSLCPKHETSGDWNSWSEDPYWSNSIEQSEGSWWEEQTPWPSAGWYPEKSSFFTENEMNNPSRGSSYIVQCLITEPERAAASNQRPEWADHISTTCKTSVQPQRFLKVAENPTHAILDLGCTRSMGSMMAVMAFEEAAWEHNITCEWLRCWTKMSFANSKSEWLEWCVKVTFPCDPPVTTTIDVHETGTIPILMSLQQMMNLGFNLRCEPDAVYLTSKCLGIVEERLPFSTSQHCLIDLARIKGNVNQRVRQDSFATAAAENHSLLINSQEPSVRTPQKFLLYSDDTDEEEEGEAFAGKRIRLSEKTTVREDRPLEGETYPPGSKKKKKPPKEEARGKPRGHPDTIMDPSMLRQEPMIVGDKTEPRVDDQPVTITGTEEPDSMDEKSTKKTKKPAAKTALDKIHDRLRDKGELLKLHLKHYHMSTTNFKKRTSALQIPADIYDLYEKIVVSCESCQHRGPAPQRSKVTGMRANNFGDLWFVDHVELVIDGHLYIVLVILDAASNFLWAYPQKNMTNDETLIAIRTASEELHTRPRAICGDNYFHSNDFEHFYKYEGIRSIALGPNTPWPNRAEAGVKLFKHHAQILIHSLKELEKTIPFLRNVTVRQMLRRACWARNTSLTYGGVTPLEIAFGRRPPDIVSTENMTVAQLTTEPPESEKISSILQDEALKAHLEARQRIDLRRDLAAKIRHSEGPYHPGQSVWYWDRDQSKLRGGEWIPARVVAPDDGPMVLIDNKGQTLRVNKSKLRMNPDNWHDVVIPGLQGKDGIPTVPEEPGTSVANYSCSASLRTSLDEKGYPNCWTYGKGNCSLLQFYVESDKLSSIFAMGDTSIAQPFSLKNGFTYKDMSGYRKGIQALSNIHPRLAWISFPVNFDNDIMANFCQEVARHQTYYENFFVIAHPWKSSFWDHALVTSMHDRHSLSYYKIDLSAYDPFSQKSEKLCLLCNFPKGSLDPLSCSAGVSTRRNKTLLNSIKITDDYPVEFCENVYTFVADTIRTLKGISGPIPIQSPYHESFTNDLLDELTTNDLTALNSVFSFTSLPGCGFQVFNAREILSLPALSVVHPDVKVLMNWVNSRAKQTCLNFSTHEVQHYYPRETVLLATLRKCYFPVHCFDCCQVFRGTHTELPLALQGQGDQAAIVMWKKNDQSKRLYAGAIESLDMTGLDFSVWSIVVFYNQDGHTRRGPQTTPQPPDNSMDIDPTSGDTGPPSNPPRPPTTPGDNGQPPGSNNSTQPRYTDPRPLIRTGQYADPDLPVPRSPRHRSRSGEKNPYVEPLTPDQPMIEPDDIPVPVSRDRSRSPDLPQEHTPRSTHPRGRGRSPPSEERQEIPSSSAVPPQYHSIHTPPASPKAKSKSGPPLRPKSIPKAKATPARNASVRKRLLSGEQPEYPERKKRQEAHEEEDENEEDATDRPIEEDDHFNHEEDNQEDQEYSSYIKSIQARVKHVQNPHSCSSFWEESQYQEDLVILEDDEVWKRHTDAHKLAAMTKSFSFVRDADDNIQDISNVATLPSVNDTLYLTNSWHSRATLSEVYEDIKHLPMDERASLVAAALKVKPQSASSRMNAMPKATAHRAPRRKVNAARREATSEEKRMYSKQFVEAKKSEYKSWKDNDVFELIDMRKYQVTNYVTGRWVCTVKRDKDGNFLKCKARWVLRGFQDAQHWNLQTDSPTSTRPGFRLQCQAAANHHYDLSHIDLKTAFLQGETFDGDREVICQLPAEAEQPHYMAARLKRAAYGLNDAPRLWWNKLDSRLRSYGLVPTRADRCCYVLYSSAKHESRKTKSVRFADQSKDWKTNFSAEADQVAGSAPETPIWEANLTSPSEVNWASRSSEAANWASRSSEAPEAETNPIWEANVAKSGSPQKAVPALRHEDLDLVLEHLLDPITGSPARDKKVEGIVTIHVDDAFLTGAPEFTRRVTESLRRDFKVGSEDTNDILFVGQRVRWIDKKDQKKAHIQVDQETKVEELSEIVFNKQLQDNITCTSDLHTQYRSLLGQINWLQSRTQFQSCYAFSRCASASAGPTMGDVRALNKLARKIRAEVVVLRFWPLKGTSLRLVGFPDAAYRNNADKSSQRGQTIFLAEQRQKGRIHTRGSLIDYESQKIKKTVLSTTVSELYAFMKCFGTCQFLRGLWMDLSSTAAEIHMRTDANNLVTTASTTHLPEQRETIHMINQLRREACSGSIHDLAHVVSADCLADCLTKASAKPDALIEAVRTGTIVNVDKHQSFRELMRSKHKAYAVENDNESTSLVAWLVHNIKDAREIQTFLTFPVRQQIANYLSMS